MNEPNQITDREAELSKIIDNHLINVIAIFIYLGALVLIVIILGQILAANNLHLNWNLVLQFTDSLKWVVLLLIMFTIYKNQIPFWGLSIAKRIKKIGLNIAGNQADIEFQQKSDEQKNPTPEPDPESTASALTVEVGDDVTSEEVVNNEIESTTTNTDTSVENLQGLVDFWRQMFEFERIYRNIFGSQINALLYLNDNKRADITKLIVFLNEHIQKSNGKVFTDILSYLNYLSVNELIEWDATKQEYRVTIKGKKFVNFIIAQNLPINKEG